MSNTRLKLTKNQAKAKQHPDAKLLLFENYAISSFMLQSKNNMRYSKQCAKKKSASFYWIILLIIMKIRLEMKNRLRRYDVKKTKPRHGHKYTKYKTCLSTMMVMCNK